MSRRVALEPGAHEVPELNFDEDRRDVICPNCEVPLRHLGFYSICPRCHLTPKQLGLIP